MLKYALLLLFLYVFANTASPYQGQTRQEYIESVRFENYIYKVRPEARNHKKDVRIFIYFANERSKKDKLCKYLAYAQAAWEGKFFEKPNAHTVGGKGERTYYQFMEGTLKDLGYNVANIALIKNTVEARNKHFRSCLRMAKGNNRKALQIYNGGLGYCNSRDAKRYAETVLKLRDKIIKVVKG